MCVVCISYMYTTNVCTNVHLCLCTLVFCTPVSVHFARAKAGEVDEAGDDLFANPVGGQSGHTRLSSNLLESGDNMALMAAADGAAGDHLEQVGGQGKCGRLMADVKAFPITFWLVCVIITLFYNLVFPFLADANSFIMSKYGYTEANAGHVSSIVYLCSMIASPFLGKS